MIRTRSLWWGSKVARLGTLHSWFEFPTKIGMKSPNYRYQVPFAAQKWRKSPLLNLFWTSWLKKMRRRRDAAAVAGGVFFCWRCDTVRPRSWSHPGGKKKAHPERAVALHPWKLERDLLPNKAPMFIEKIQSLLSGFSWSPNIAQYKRNIQSFWPLLNSPIKLESTRLPSKEKGCQVVHRNLFLWCFGSAEKSAVIRHTCLEP